MDIAQGFIFKSPRCLLYKARKLAIREYDELRWEIVVEPEEKTKDRYKILIYKSNVEPYTESNVLISLQQMRIMEKSQNRIVLQDWVLDDIELPTTHFSFIINIHDDQIFSCILNNYDDKKDFIFLNESELEDPYPDIYDLYQLNKNGIFKENAGGGWFEWTYVNNQRNGEWKAYDSKGEIEEIGNYLNGQANGEYKAFLQNGKVKYMGFFKNGRKNGLWKYCDPKGVLKIEGNYKDNKKVGKWIYYTEKGELDNIEDYGVDGNHLFFKDIHGAGEIICIDCGFSQNMKGLLHSSPSLTTTTWYRGHQCQACGKFQTRSSTPQQREIIDLTCECGGMIEREKPVFCPMCKSLNVEYQIRYMT